MTELHIEEDAILSHCHKRQQSSQMSTQISSKSGGEKTGAPCQCLKRCLATVHTFKILMRMHIEIQCFTYLIGK